MRGAVLNVAVEWESLPKLPRFRMERTMKKLIRYVLPEHFAAIYSACDKAALPDPLPDPAPDWWRAVLVFASMTGW